MARCSAAAAAVEVFGGGVGPTGSQGCLEGGRGPQAARDIWRRGTADALHNDSVGTVNSGTATGGTTTAYKYKCITGVINHALCVPLLCHYYIS